MTIKVALDVMGGDQAPDEVIRGAVRAEADFPDVELIYVGPTEIIKETYSRCSSLNKTPTIVDAQEVIAMGDSPLAALREKKDNSISKALSLHKAGDAHAFVSAGNTGACVAAATLQLRMLEGVQRPGIACTFPSKTGMCLVLDCGANVNARPRHLLEYAIIGQAFASLVNNQKNVRVGLLNIGEEAAKGNELVKESFDLLNENKEKINFIGNVEARDIFEGSVDVVVCEGFVGNSLLKCAEGLSSLFFSSLKGTIYRNFLTRLGGGLLKKGLKEMIKNGDPNEFGGAPLLGVNGNVIISHGSSNAWGIRNAVRIAREMVINELNVNIQRQL